jgi:hypothetical protein
MWLRAFEELGYELPLLLDLLLSVLIFGLFIYGLASLVWFEIPRTRKKARDGPIISVLSLIQLALCIAVMMIVGERAGLNRRDAIHLGILVSTTPFILWWIYASREPLPDSERAESTR